MLLGRHLILPGVWLGTQVAAGIWPGLDLDQTLEGLKADGITAIVNCTGEQRAFESSLCYRCLNLAHKPDSNDPDFVDFGDAVDDLVGFIEEELSNGGGVLVHCK